MSWDSTLVKLASYTVRGTLRTVGGRVTKDRYRALLTGVIAGVLSEHPDLTPAQAARSAESATGDPAAPELIVPSARSPEPAAPAASERNGVESRSADGTGTGSGGTASATSATGTTRKTTARRRRSGSKTSTERKTTKKTAGTTKKAAARKKTRKTGGSKTGAAKSTGGR